MPAQTLRGPLTALPLRAAVEGLTKAAPTEWLMAAAARAAAGAAAEVFANARQGRSGRARPGSGSQQRGAAGATGGSRSRSGRGSQRSAQDILAIVPYLNNAHAAESGVAVWRCEFEHGVDVRIAPDISAERSDKALEAGDIFRVSEERLGKDGVLYLRLEDGAGWVFDRKPGLGILCVRQRAAAATLVPRGSSRSGSCGSGTGDKSGRPVDACGADHAAEPEARTGSPPRDSPQMAGTTAGSRPGRRRGGRGATHRVQHESGPASHSAAGAGGQLGQEAMQCEPVAQAVVASAAPTQGCMSQLPVQSGDLLITAALLREIEGTTHEAQVMAGGNSEERPQALQSDQNTEVDRARFEWAGALQAERQRRVLEEGAASAWRAAALAVEQHMCQASPGTANAFASAQQPPRAEHADAGDASAAPPQAATGAEAPPGDAAPQAGSRAAASGRLSGSMAEMVWSAQEAFFHPGAHRDDALLATAHVAKAEKSMFDLVVADCAAMWSEIHMAEQVAVVAEQDAAETERAAHVCQARELRAHCLEREAWRLMPSEPLISMALDAEATCPLSSVSFVEPCGLGTWVLDPIEQNVSRTRNVAGVDQDAQGASDQMSASLVANDFAVAEDCSWAGQQASIHMSEDFANELDAMRLDYHHYGRQAGQPIDSMERNNAATMLDTVGCVNSVGVAAPRNGQQAKADTNPANLDPNINAEAARSCAGELDIQVQASAKHLGIGAPEDERTEAQMMQFADLETAACAEAFMHIEFARREKQQADAAAAAIVHGARKHIENAEQVVHERLRSVQQATERVRASMSSLESVVEKARAAEEWSALVGHETAQAVGEVALEGKRQIADALEEVNFRGNALGHFVHAAKSDAEDAVHEAVAQVAAAEQEAAEWMARAAARRQHQQEEREARVGHLEWSLTETRAEEADAEREVDASEHAAAFSIEHAHLARDAELRESRSRAAVCEKRIAQKIASLEADLRMEAQGPDVVDHTLADQVRSAAHDAEQNFNLARAQADAAKRRVAEAVIEYKELVNAINRREASSDHAMARGWSALGAASQAKVQAALQQVAGVSMAAGAALKRAREELDCKVVASAAGQDHARASEAAAAELERLCRLSCQRAGDRAALVDEARSEQVFVAQSCDELAEAAEQAAKEAIAAAEVARDQHDRDADQRAAAAEVLAAGAEQHALDVERATEAAAKAAAEVFQRARRSAEEQVRGAEEKAIDAERAAQEAMDCSRNSQLVLSEYFRKALEARIAPSGMAAGCCTTALYGTTPPKDASVDYWQDHMAAGKGFEAQLLNRSYQHAPGWGSLRDSVRRSLYEQVSGARRHLSFGNTG